MPKNESEKLRILAVDDSRVILKAMHKILGDTYDIVDARDGEEAWVILESESAICAVFTDMQMPKLDGLGLLKRIRSAEDNLIKSLPVILVTSAEDDDKTVKEAFSLGITDLISKPFDSLMLLARARTHVKTRLLTLDEPTASIDTVTKLANKSYFLDRGEKERAFSIRHKHSSAVSLLAIDNFKILEREDKDIVKAILMKVASRISALIRQEDTLAYLGPGQFGILTLSIEIEDAVELTERILKKIKSKEFVHKNIHVSMTMSIGLAIAVDGDDRNFKAIAQEANSYLTQAIKAGGDRVITKPINNKVSNTDQKLESVFKILDQTLDLINKSWENTQAQHVGTIMLKLLPLFRRCNSKLKLGLEKNLDELQKTLSK